MAPAVFVVKLEGARWRNEIGGGSMVPGLGAKTLTKRHEVSRHNLKRDIRSRERRSRTVVGDGQGGGAVDPSRKGVKESHVTYALSNKNVLRERT